jgi:predicted RNA-binding Zn-ribbon protein involved in translation (DUF1610 family)
VNRADVDAYVRKIDAYVRKIVERLSWQQGRERQECPACGSNYIRRVHRRLPWRYVFARYGAYRYQCANCARNFYLRGP